MCGKIEFVSMPGAHTFGIDPVTGKPPPWRVRRLTLTEIVRLYPDKAAEIRTKYQTPDTLQKEEST